MASAPSGRSSSNWWKVGGAILALFLTLQAIEVPVLQESPPEKLTSRNNVRFSNGKMDLVPGELPGYTGWARPERTLAGLFSIESVSMNPQVGEEFVVTVKCMGNADCQKGRSMFFLRAYGPSVIPGVVTNKGKGVYSMKFVPPDSGTYTVEVVLTFSNPLPLEEFPLQGQAEPAFEGYLLPGFPLQISVRAAVNGNKIDSSKQPLCRTHDLVENTLEGAAWKARWKVVSKSNGPGYKSETIDLPVSDEGYKSNINSFGVCMDYQYLSKCMLLPEKAIGEKVRNTPSFASCGKNLQILFVGDSVLRNQKAVFDDLVQGLPNIETVYINMYGGYRRFEAQGPPLQSRLEDNAALSPSSAKVVVFNSGLHDIHRLCGDEFKEDRYTYLDKEKLDSGSFSCTQEYRALLKQLATRIKDFSADLNIFQSTTAAWPKYGNYGIEWPLGAQVMPMASDAVPSFNQIAFDVLAAFEDTIKIVDGYWITYSRPDNREVGDIGKKLSHPGLEVQSAMIRTWSTVILEAMCQESMP